MKENRLGDAGDLHCHTRISDGSMSPEDLVGYAKRLGLGTIAVTDHDCMCGVDEAARRGKELGVRVIPGMEVSAYDFKRAKKVHLLCYLPVKKEALLSYCAHTLALRHAASLKIIDILSERYPIDAETVRKYQSGSGTIYKQHIMTALMDMGYTMSAFGKLYNELFSTKTGWALVKSSYPDALEAMEMIRDSGGIGVLAHPGLYGNFELIGELCEKGLAGIEVYHTSHSAEDESRALGEARSRGLLVTGGSDFHGFYMSGPCTLAEQNVSGDDLHAFLDRCGRLRAGA